MPEVEGARSFRVDGETYDLFMGRYSKPLAQLFADAAGVAAGQSALDVGCGPGALTTVLVDRLGAASVTACDPSPSFVEACADRHPEVRVRAGRAEALPFDADRFDVVLAQLVLHFVSDPAEAAKEMVRVARPGATIGACVWDFDQGLDMLRHFWDAALALDTDAPDEARTLRFGRAGELVELFDAAGLQHTEEAELTVSSTYRDFDELWSGFRAGVGPAGDYCRSLPRPACDRLERRLNVELGEPSGPFTLNAVARYALGHTNPN